MYLLYYSNLPVRKSGKIYISIEVESIYNAVYQDDGSEVYLVDKVVRGSSGSVGSSMAGSFGNARPLPQPQQYFLFQPADLYLADPQRRGHLHLGMLGCMVLLSGAMYGGMALYEKLSAGKDTAGPADSPDGVKGEGEGLDTEQDAVGVMSGSVVYSQAELDQEVAEAVARAQDEEAVRVLNGIKESLSAGTTTVETLRPYYPDDIVVVSDGRFV